MGAGANGINFLMGFWDFEERLAPADTGDGFQDWNPGSGIFIPDALLRRRSSGTNSRQRRFTLHVTIRAFLAPTLSPETSCRDFVCAQGAGLMAAACAEAAQGISHL